jgi:ribosomal protein S18 acetylase RimI-like enzyme
MTRALEACARAQFRHVFLTVLPDNVAAQALYAAFGFVKLAESVHYRAPGHTP